MARINHVSVHADDLQTSVAFYVHLLDAEPLPTPNFGVPVQWLGLGDTQLHVFERAARAPSHHHFAVTVEELEPVYRRAEALGAFDHEAFGGHLIELPGDVAQTYVRDPAGNLMELDTPGASRLPEDLRRVIKPLASLHEQSEENLRGRLYVGDPAPR
jgi:catechol 2,3-dioxygenase-like lactoylglutathione lyase family enzyme